MFEGKNKVVYLPDDEAYHYWEMFENTYAIQCGEALYCYLLEGRDIALLIDTAYGRGDFPHVIERLTQKPIIVANTHGHFDHTGGNAWFPKVYMHPIAAETARHNYHGKDPKPIDEKFWANMPYQDYEIVLIDDGYVFDLGERKVEAIHTPAHSPGSLSFIDHKCRLLFSGDEFDSGQANVPNIKAVAAFLENMKKLKARESEYDFILPQHNGGPITKRYIDYFIKNAEDILAGNPHLAGIRDAPGSENPHNKIRSRLWHSSICYNPDNERRT